MQGREVEVTHVTNQPNDSKTGWDDIQLVGELGSFVRSCRQLRQIEEEEEEEEEESQMSPLELSADA
jgi:hypothetical protein